MVPFLAHRVLCLRVICLFSCGLFGCVSPCDRNCCNVGLEEEDARPAV